MPPHVLALPCWGIDSVGVDVNMSLGHFMENAYFDLYAIVLMGDPEVGKTLVAKSMCAKISEVNFDDKNNTHPHYIHTSTVDALRKCTRVLGPGIPVLLDEYTPSDRLGTRGAFTDATTLKQLLGVQDSNNVAGRCDEIVFHDEEPRVITTNSKSPNQWSHFLPDVRHLEPAARLAACSADALAIYRRVLFVVFPTHMFPIEDRADRHMQQSAAKRAKMRHCMGLPSLTGGASASSAGL
jgi:hypothetical protein